MREHKQSSLQNLVQPGAAPFHTFDTPAERRALKYADGGNKAIKISLDRTDEASRSGPQ